MPVVLSLRPHPGDVRVAREFCARELARLVGDCDQAEDVMEDAAMITSELITNAIRAGASSIRLELVPDDRFVQIAVVDDAPGDVEPAPTEPHALNGRGLHIVASLATRWGATPLPDGKKVWADLLLPSTPDLSDEVAS